MVGVAEVRGRRHRDPPRKSRRHVLCARMPPRLLARRRPRRGRCRVQQRVDRRPRQRVRAAVATRWHSAGRRSARGRGTWSRVRAQPAAPAGQRPAATGRGGDAAAPGTPRRAGHAHSPRRRPAVGVERDARRGCAASGGPPAPSPVARAGNVPTTGQPPPPPPPPGAPHGIAQGTEALHGHAGQPADVTPTGAARTAPDVTPGSAPGTPPPGAAPHGIAQGTEALHGHAGQPADVTPTGAARTAPDVTPGSAPGTPSGAHRMASPKAPKPSTATPANPPTSPRPARAATRPTSPPAIPAKART